jgi:hypothetical protein
MSKPEARSTARRDFLKTAGVLAVGGATVGSAAACDVKEPTQTAADDQALERVRGFDRAMLDAVAAAVLPESLGTPAIRAATDRFVAWADGYDPVAEEMHGYGYADIRYLPAQRSVLSAALRTERGDRLPAPLGARHVALAVLAHWSSSPEAWNLALGAQVSPATCRTLGDAVKRPLPLAGERA